MCIRDSYNFDMKFFSAKLDDAIKNIFHGEPIKIILEPGRSIVAEAGIIESEVILVSKKNESDKKRWVYLDIGRFDWFSQGYLGISQSKNVITDVRYSAVPNEVDGLWGIKVEPSKKSSEHIEWVVNRTDYERKWKRFRSLLSGEGCNKIGEQS